MSWERSWSFFDATKPYPEKLNSRYIMLQFTLCFYLLCTAHGAEIYPFNKTLGNSIGGLNTRAHRTLESRKRTWVCHQLQPKTDATDSKILPSRPKARTMTCPFVFPPSRTSNMCHSRILSQRKRLDTLGEFPELSLAGHIVMVKDLGVLVKITVHEAKHWGIWFIWRQLSPRLHSRTHESFSSQNRAIKMSWNII